jgi:hypothetical protein
LLLGLARAVTLEVLRQHRPSFVAWAHCLVMAVVLLHAYEAVAWKQACL